MARSKFVALFMGTVCITACGAIAESLAPNRDAAAIVFYNVPDTLFVGDSAGAFVDVNDKDGRPAKNDTVVVWQSSNTAVIATDATHPPTPTPHGFSWLLARSSGQSTIVAHTNKVSASKLVTVVGPGDVAASDQRFGYALADQPAASAPYTPSAAYRFSSSGGAITVTRDSTGWYRVRFAGLGRRPGHRDNVQVTAYGSPPGIHCKLLSWITEGADLVVPVHCHQPGTVGAAVVDSRFTILVSGARAYDLATPFAFAERLPMTQNLTLDTSATAFNSVTGHITFGRFGTGIYNFVFPGLSTFSGAQSLQVTGVNQSTARCLASNYDLAQSVLQAGCYNADGAASDERVSVMWFTRGRVGHRYGFASAANPAGLNSPLAAGFTFNSSGGAVSSRRLGVGQWTVTFAGLGRPTGATEIVILSAFKDTNHSCSIVSWSNTGTADLIVTLQCFNASGALFDGRSSILVIE